MSTAERTNPTLWEKVKREILRSKKGGEEGQWSARKAQLAVQEYKKRGGGYAGEKRADNDLHEWTEENWGTRSGRRSRDTGERYLPQEARRALSPEEYRRTTARKRADMRDGRQFSAQPADIAAKTAPYRHGGEVPTKDALMKAARDAGIEGRSKMTKGELARALSAKDARSEDAEPSKKDLQAAARVLGLSGVGSMTKGDLSSAIREAMKDAPDRLTRDDLDRIARRFAVGGRSALDKSGLSKAIVAAT